MPAGKGFADIVYIPRPEFLQDVPALIVELKWNQDAETAMQQNKKRDYPDSLADYTGELQLVGINYDKQSKRHACIIESLEIHE